MVYLTIKSQSQDVTTNMEKDTNGRTDNEKKTRGSCVQGT